MATNADDGGGGGPLEDRREKREGETPSHDRSRKAASGTVGQKNSLLIFAFLSLLWLPLEKKCYPEAVYGEVYMLLFTCREISRRV